MRKFVLAALALSALAAAIAPPADAKKVQVQREGRWLNHPRNAGIAGAFPNAYDTVYPNINGAIIPARAIAAAETTVVTSVIDWTMPPYEFQNGWAGVTNPTTSFGDTIIIARLFVWSDSAVAQNLSAIT